MQGNIDYIIHFILTIDGIILFTRSRINHLIFHPARKMATWCNICFVLQQNVEICNWKVHFLQVWYNQFLNQTHQWITLKYIFCDPYIECKNILYIYFINRAKWMYILHLWIYILPKWITYKILHKIFNEVRRTKMKRN